MSGEFFQADNSAPQATIKSSTNMWVANGPNDKKKGIIIGDSNQYGNTLGVKSGGNSLSLSLGGLGGRLGSILQNIGGPLVAGLNAANEVYQTAQEIKDAVENININDALGLAFPGINSALNSLNPALGGLLTDILGKNSLNNVNGNNISGTYEDVKNTLDIIQGITNKDRPLVNLTTGVANDAMSALLADLVKNGVSSAFADYAGDPNDIDGLDFIEVQRLAFNLLDLSWYFPDMLVFQDVTEYFGLRGPGEPLYAGGFINGWDANYIKKVAQNYKVPEIATYSSGLMSPFLMLVKNFYTANTFWAIADDEIVDGFDKTSPFTQPRNWIDTYSYSEASEDFTKVIKHGSATVISIDEDDPGVLKLTESEVQTRLTDHLDAENNPVLRIEDNSSLKWLDFGLKSNGTDINTLIALNKRYGLNLSISNQYAELVLA